MGFFKNLTGNSVGPALSAGAGPNGMPAWLSALGASELPGGGFGGNRSFRVGNDVYTGAYTPGDVDHGVGAAFVGDFYKYGFNKQAWAGQGSVLNGTPFEKLDLSGNVIGSGKWEGIQDKNFGLDTAVVAIVGAILGGAAMAGAGAGAGTVAEGAALETVSEGFGAAYEASVAGGASGVGAGAAIETVSEGFGPVYESWASGVPQGWQLPAETVSEGFGQQYEQAVSGARTPTVSPTAPQSPQPGSPTNPAPPATAPTVQSALEKLGVSKAVDKLGGSLLSAGVSSLVGDLMSPKPDMAAPTVGDIPRTADTKTKAVSEMPDPLAQQRSRKRSIIEQLGRRGRSSTVMTRGGGRLGG